MRSRNLKETQLKKTVLKLKIYTAAALLCAVTLLAEDAKERLIIAVSAETYGDGRSLFYSAKDVDNILFYLSNLSPAPVELKRLREPSLDRFKAVMKGATRKSSYGELLLIYSGHSDDRGLLLKDGRYSYSRLRRRLRRAKAKRSCIIIDGCMSGAYIKRRLDSAILASAAKGTESYESDMLRGSHFSAALLGAMASPAAQRLSVSNAYKLMKGSGSETSPQYHAGESGGFILCDYSSVGEGAELKLKRKGLFYAFNKEAAYILPQNSGRIFLFPGFYAYIREDGRKRVVDKGIFQAVGSKEGFEANDILVGRTVDLTNIPAHRRH